MRHLAIDYGLRRVGLALSDEGGQFAQPLTVLSISGPQQATREVLRVIEREGPAVLVVGYPMNMDDTPGPMARAVVSWTDELSRQSGLPVVYVDERLTSFDAEQQLTRRKRGGEKMTRGRKKQLLDALSAATFLQDYLDGRLSAIEPGKSDAS